VPECDFVAVKRKLLIDPAAVEHEAASIYQGVEGDRIVRFGRRVCSVNPTTSTGID
jgi:hypothetical protein